MKLSRKVSVILTLAVAFMMLVVPTSTALGGGGTEYSKNTLSVGSGTNLIDETIPEIPSKTILYQTYLDSTSTDYKSYNFDFTSDSTIVQMIPYAWNTLSQIVSSNGAYSSIVFNGWNVTYTESGKEYGLYVTYNGGSYTYSAEYVKSDTADSVSCRIMPGDGINFGNTAGYDPDNGVLTLPKNADTITFTAKWDIPTIITYYNGSAMPNFNNQYDPISGNGSIFTNIIYAPNKCNIYETYSSSTILGKPSNLNYSVSNGLGNDVYFENINLYSYYPVKTSHRLIVGENVETIYDKSGNWYETVNNYSPSGYININATGYSNSHLVILSGTYGVVSSDITNKDSYVSIGSMTRDKGPKIALLYGGSEASRTTIENSHIVVSSGTIIELLGGSRYVSSTSSNIEVRGGYVSYLTGGPRQGDAVIGSGPDAVAVKIFVSGGIVDYLFSGAKDGNSKNSKTAPVYGNVEIKVSDGNVYGLFGGGYDFWAKTVYNGVIGNIGILITGGTIGNDPYIDWQDLDNSIGTKPSDYYSIDPGVYGGGYRGSVLGNVTIKIGAPTSASISQPNVYGNVYGGGSGGPDYSLRNNYDGNDDTTGQSYIGSKDTKSADVKVTIGTATVSGDIYGGGKGVAKSSYVKTMYNGSHNSTIIGIFTDYDPNLKNFNVATVFGTTTVQIQNGASIGGNVFGGGKGVSKSAWIGYDDSQNGLQNIISSRLYNMVGSNVAGDIKENLKLNKANYQWQYCDGKSTTFTDIQNANSSSFNASEYSGYIRLKMTVIDSNNKPIETVYSNAVGFQGGLISQQPISIKDWESWNVELSQIAAVSNASTVNICGGTISGNVYGGGSYGAVGSIIYIDDTATGLHRHELSGGTTTINIQKGAIQGSVFGGGMGEPDNVTTGSVGSSSSVLIGNDANSPTISKNVYGGGENGFIGGALIAIHFTDVDKAQPSMEPLSINGTKTNTYYFVIDVAYSDKEGGAEAPGTSMVTIHNLNDPHTLSVTDVYGGGYGVNATITGNTDVTVAGGHVNNVYGGGELGMVGKLTGHGSGSTLHLQEGSTAVKIIGATVKGNNEPKVIVEGSIFGGGKGQYTTSADEIILGSVGGNTSVSVESETLRGVLIKGSVLGGGKLGLVGSYIVSDKNGDGTGGNQLNFTGGATKVKITGGLVYDNVFGGGMGSPYNTLSGAVGRTQVVISGTASVDSDNKRGGLINTTTQIGVGSNDPIPYNNSLLSQNANNNIENNYNNLNSNGILSAGEESAGETNILPLTDFSGITAGEGKLLIAVVKPHYGTITVSETVNSTDIVLNAAGTATQNDGTKKFNYNIYSVTSGSSLKLTYSDSNERYSPDWNICSIINPTPTNLGSSNPLIYSVTNASDKSTIYAVENDSYNTNISITKPSNGQINVLLDGQKIAPLRDAGTAYIFAAPVSKTLKLIYEAPANSGYYVTSWTGANADTSDKDTATLTVPAKGTSVIVSVATSNDYEIAVEKPNGGTIIVYDLTTPTLKPDAPSGADKNLISNLIPLTGTDDDKFSTYQVSFGTKLMFEYKPTSDYTFVKEWASNPLTNMSQAADTPNIAVMTVTGKSIISVSEGPSIGNVYGGGAYGIVGNITLDLSSGEDGIHPIIGSDNKALVEVAILGGKIGTDNPGSISTGNVFGGGYGPNATVAGSTHVYIGSAPDYVTNVSQSCLEINDSVYGGGEMGSIGAVNTNGDLFSSGSTYTPEIFSNVSICQSIKSNVIIIGKPIYLSELGESPVEYTGKVFGGGQGGDIPESVLKSTLPTGVNVNNTNLIRNGYAVVYGTTNVVISGVPDGESSLKNKDSNVRIGSGVYGGGEGLIKGQSRQTAGISNEEAILDSVDYGRVTGATESVASRVFINDAVITGSVSGGGKLGILGKFDSTTNLYTGKDSIVYVSGFVRSNVFGGGEGHADSAVSGAVGNSLVIIGGNAEIGSNDGIHTVPGPDGLDISGGNVYGGGRLSIIGDNVKVNPGNPGSLVKYESDNASETNIVILGGKVLNSVYGGGFSPKATIAGSTHVYVGDAYNDIKNNSNLISNHALCSQLHKFFITVNGILTSGTADTEPSGIIIGNIYGGGEMGSVGSTTLVKEDAGKQLDPNAKYDTNGDGFTDKDDGWVSANININSSSTKVTIGIDKPAFQAATGNIYGGGKGVLNSVIHDIPGYAIIRGNTSVSIEGDFNKHCVSIMGNVFGGGEGIISDVASIRYAEVYDYTEVSVKNAVVKGNVYGGGSYGVVGHFFDSQPKNGDKITITQYDDNGKVKLITGTVSIDEATKKVTITYTDETGNSATISDLDIVNREFCGDDVFFDTTDSKFKPGPKAYNGVGTAKVSIYNANVEGSVFGGGKGAKTNILAGAVGRGTEVNIEVSATGPSSTITSVDNGRTVIGGGTAGGNVYGGGEYGVVGSIVTQIIGTGSFSPVKVLHVSHVSNLDDFPTNGDYNNYDFNKGNDIDLVVNILGGTINGSVFGSGRGEEIRLEGVNYEGLTVSYYKLSSFGRTEVNVANGIIKSSVYGGSQNGETGGFTVLQRAQSFTDNYWRSKGEPYAPPSNVPSDVRDNGYLVDGKLVKADLTNFSATFVNVIGGTINGSIFGGGYFGAVYGTCHVHMGWNSLMPDPENSVKNGDCHYYNDYGDGNYGSKEHPFNLNNKKTLISNLFISGSVYAGGDRGIPDGEVNYDFITIYGNSHILLNGTNYAAGTDQITNPEKQMAAMYVGGSLFGSGNSCSAFYDTPELSHFITIKNYQAVTEGTSFSLNSIQRASNVTLINSKLRLIGRSDGANADPTALYSLNYIYNLTLQSSNEGSSQIILDAPVKDLRGIKSQVYDGSAGKYINTILDNPYNTIQLNGGIVLEVKKDSGSPDRDFGPVNGYFYLDVDLLSYYNAYVYGQIQMEGNEKSATGGFVYGPSFYGVRFGEIPHVDSRTPTETTDTLETGYRAWLPGGGGGHLTTSATVVATNTTKVDDPSLTDNNNKAYLNTGDITLPMTSAGSRYKLVGYNIYPSQIASLSDENRSLKLVSGEKTNPINDTFNGTDKNTTFKLKISVGNGFVQETGKNPYFWFIDGGTVDDAKDVWTLNTSGGVLPTFKLELYSQGVTKTTVAGNILLTVQEEKPTGEFDENNKEIYSPGDEININITIETQADAFGDAVTDSNSNRYNKDGQSNHINYEDKTTLYVNSAGKYSLQYIIPPIGNAAYELTLKNVGLTFLNTNATLVDNPSLINEKNQYAISIKANDVKNREGWSDYLSNETFLTAGDIANGIKIGTTDGRYQAGILITLYSLKPTTDTPEGYPAGTITFEIDYNLAQRASGLSQQAASVQPESGKIYIDNSISTQLEIYTVSFVPGTGVASIPSKQVSSGDTLSQDNKGFVDDLNKNPPKKEGMTFKEWRKLIGYAIDTNGNYIPELSESAFKLDEQVITENTTLYAVYSYAVIFHFGYNNSEGKENIATLSVGDDGKINQSEFNNLKPDRPGYKFDGWYKSSTDFIDAYKFDVNDKITKTIDVYAKWNPISYTIHFDANYNGTETAPIVPNDITCTLDNPNIELSAPTSFPKDKTFGGWSTERNATTGSFSINLNDYITLADPMNNITLYAVWTDKPVIQVKLDKSDTSATFSYSIDNGSTWINFTNSFSVDKSTAVQIKCTLAGDGRYNITNATYGLIGSTGINTAETGGNTEYIFSIGTITGNTSVVVHLEGQKHTVKLDASGGTIAPAGTSNIEVVYGKTFTALFTDGNYSITADRTGYTFNGWYLQSDATQKLITSADRVNVTTNNEILVASYTPISYDVTLATGSHVSVLINSKTYSENSTNTLEKIASQNTELQFSVLIPKGYTQTDVSKILSIKMGSSLDAATLLTAENYSIGGGVSTDEYTTYTVIIKQNVINSNLYIDLGNATLNTYTISGNVTDNGTPAGKLSGISIIYLLNGVESKTATTDADGKYSIGSIPHGATVSISINEWGYDNYSQDLGVIINDGAEDMILNKNLSVKYDLNGGSETAPIDDKKYGPKDTITLNNETRFTKTGYTFAGWAVSKTGTALTTNTYTINKVDFTGNTITFYAVWTAKTYTVTYNPNDGTGTITDGTATYDSNFTFSNGNEFTKNNYTLMRWNTQADGNGTPYDLEATIKWTTDSDLTLYAVWELKTYTVTVTDRLNTNDKIITSDYNAYIFAMGSSIADPKESDAIKLNELTTGGYTKSKVPAGTYNIFFNLKEYDLTPGETTLSSLAKLKETLVVGENEDNSVVVQLWSIDFNFGIASNKGSYGNMKDDRLLVVDEALPYQYNPFLIGANGNKLNDNEWILPTSDGYYFVGWYTDLEGKMPWDSSKPVKEQVNVYAKWVKKELTITFKNSNSSTYNGTDLASSLGSISNITVKKTYRVGDVDLTPSEAILKNLNFSWSKNDVSIDEVKDAGTYTLTLTGKSPKYIPTILSTAGGIYYVNIIESTAEVNDFSGSANYIIDPLPITITPDANQWKYYGDDFNHIHQSNPNSFSVFTYMASITEGGSTFTPGTDPYSAYALLENINFSVVQSDGTTLIDQYADVRSDYKIIFSSQDNINNSNPNYTIKLADTLVSFEIKRLPIIIKPDEYQWKYYGDPDDQIYKTDAAGNISDLSKMDYKVFAKMNGTEINASSEWLTLDDWNTTYATPSLTGNYNQLSGINVSYDGADQFKDVGKYDTTASGPENSNYDISIYADNSGNKIKFEVKKLPIFIVPLADQWKYYGYDLTDPSKIDIDDDNSISCIFIGEKGTPSPVKSDKLKFDTYDFRSINIDQSTHKIEFTSGTYKPLDGILYSTMLEKSSSVMSNDIQTQYEFDISHLINKNGTGEAINTNYEIWDINSYNAANPNSYSNKQPSSDKTILGAGSETIPQTASHTVVEARPVIISWSDGPYTYDGNNQKEKVIATYADAAGNLQTFSTNSLSFEGPNGVTDFLVAGDYTVTADVSSLTDYDFGSTHTYKVTMNKKSLTITLNNLTIEYDSTTSFTFDLPNGNITYTDLASGDTITKVKIQTKDKNIGSYTISSTDIVLPEKCISANNGIDDRTNCYEVSVTSGSKLTITAKAVTINVDNKEKNYGENDPIFTGSVTGLINSDDLGTITYSRTNSTVNDVGTYTDVLTASYDTNSNYSVEVNNGDFEIKAAEMSVTVTFNSNGGSEVSSVDVVSGNKVTKPADPTKSGYKFAGWYKDAALTDPWDFDKDVVTADITLYAKWEPTDEPTPTIYKVEYDANGGEGEVPKTELHFAGEFVTVKSADLRKNGYTFKGWCDSVTQTIYQPDEKFRMPSRDVCLTAVWESDPISGKEVSVTFIVDNEIYGISSTHINTALNGAMQADPIKEGFDFLGWYTKEGEIFTSETVVNNDMTVYAKFELNEDYVLVTYIIDSEVYMTLACKKTKIIEPNISAGMGKELNGWYTDKELQNKFDFNTIIEGDSLTLYAEWKNKDLLPIAALLIILFLILLIIAMTKRVSFYESLESEKKYNSAVIFWKGVLGEKFPLPPSSDKEFLGWYSEEGELITDETEIRKSMKLYARWKG